MKRITKTRLPDGSTFDYDKTPRPLAQGHPNAGKLQAHLESAESWRKVSPNCEGRMIHDHVKAKAVIMDHPKSAEIVKAAPLTEVSIQAVWDEHHALVACFHPPSADDPDRLESGWCVTEFRWASEDGRKEGMALVAATCAAAELCS